MSEASSVEIWLWLQMVMSPHNPKTALILSQFDNNAKAAAEAVRDGEIQFRTMKSAELPKSEAAR